MLYVSDIMDNKYYITDTSDNVTECISRQKLLEIIKLGISIQGVVVYSDKVSIKQCSPESVLSSLRLMYAKDFDLVLVDSKIILKRYKGDSPNVAIPYGVSSLGDYCFSECKNLESVDIPSSVISIGTECFKDCSSLESIVIPSSVDEMGYYCFSFCDSLKFIKAPSALEYMMQYCRKPDTCKVEYY